MESHQIYKELDGFDQKYNIYKGLIRGIREAKLKILTTMARGVIMCLWPDAVQSV